MPAVFVYKTKSELSLSNVDTSEVKGKTLPDGLLYDDAIKTLCGKLSANKKESIDTQTISKEAQDAIDDYVRPGAIPDWNTANPGSSIIHVHEPTGETTVFYKVG